MKNQLSDLKSKLELIEKTLLEQVVVVDPQINTELSNNVFEERIKEILSTKENEIIKINVGGKHFATRLSTIMNVKDNLFHKMILSKKFDLSKEIFIDRNPLLFPMIIDYLRHKRINISKLPSDQYADFKEEIIYYELLELEAEMGKKLEMIDYVKVEVNAFYYESSNLVGSMDVKTLLKTDLTTGICTTSPGWMIVEFNREAEFEEIEIGGYTGKSDWVYSGGYGAGGSIETSLDKKVWVNVGSIPSEFGTTIKTARLRKSIGKFIRFQTTSWLGIGYLKIKNI